MTDEYAAEVAMEVSEVGRIDDGTVDLLLQRVVIRPGGTTGWHFHADHVWGFVSEGVLTHENRTGAVDGTFGPGDYIVEGVGPENLHLGTNRGSVPVVLYSARFLSAPPEPPTP